MKLRFLFKDFVWGVLAGLLFGSIFWSYTAYFDVKIPLLQLALGISFITFGFGIIAGMIGIKKLLDNLPNINL
ncbi:MAG: hypothetical protein AAGE96_12800 [Cyanobacteria bacterium P01_G01_bin.19]